MPLSSLTDPIDLARAQGALEIAWSKLEPEVPQYDRDDARTRLAHIIASYAIVAVDESDLVSRALERFRSKPAL